MTKYCVVREIRFPKGRRPLSTMYLVPWGLDGVGSRTSYHYNWHTSVGYALKFRFREAARIVAGLNSGVGGHHERFLMEPIE